MRRITLDLTDAQIVKLRELMDALPLSGYVDLILPVLKALPLSAAESPSADATAASTSPSGAAVGFSLHAFTPKAKAMLPEITRQLSRLPHTGDL
jgi:hypothetical protein